MVKILVYKSVFTNDIQSIPKKVLIKYINDSLKFYEPFQNNDTSFDITITNKGIITIYLLTNNDIYSKTKLRKYIKNCFNYGFAENGLIFTYLKKEYVITLKR